MIDPDRPPFGPREALTLLTLAAIPWLAIIWLTLALIKLFD